MDIRRVVAVSGAIELFVGRIAAPGGPESTAVRRPLTCH